MAATVSHSLCVRRVGCCSRARTTSRTKALSLFLVPSINKFEDVINTYSADCALSIGIALAHVQWRLCFCREGACTVAPVFAQRRPDATASLFFACLNNF